MVRQTAVAGQFYPGSPTQLRSELELLVPQGVRKRVLGVVAPHAGYIYSGKVAGKLFGSIEVPKSVVLLGPNHHGTGAPAALYPAGEWLTPLGSVPINGKLSKLILKHAPMVTEDASAHRLEHSLEVQLPFLQQANPEVSIAALSLSLNDFDTCFALGQSIARAVTEFGEDVLILASSDMTHYESAASAKSKDELALRELKRLDPQRLLTVCQQNRITMCGVIPATVMLVATKALGAASCELIGYATSGEVNGDLRRVVGYASLAVT